jgi:hypothetical protein
VGVGVGVGVAVGDGVGVAAFTTNLELTLVAKVSESIVPDVVNGERSTVEVVAQYCTPVPSG